MFHKVRKNHWLCVVLVVALLVMMIAPAAMASANTARVKVFIGFTSNPGPAEEALVRAFGGTVNNTYSIIPAIAAELPERALAGLLKNPQVTVIEPDIEIYAIDTSDYTKELDQTWGVKHIGAGLVHDSGSFGANIKVAVIDSGISPHSDLAGISGGYDFVNDDSNPADDNGHGTHVAGTIAALRNGSGVVGAAPEVELYALKVLGASGGGSFSSVIAALEWAVNEGIQVTNNSYGSSGDPGTLVKAAFDNSYASGILHVAAAGNAGNLRGIGDNVGYPAKYASVIAVAATDKNNKRASFSSTGPAVEISAPGVSINSTLFNGGYGTMSGTSMASPHVAGVAALTWAANKGLTNEQIRGILQEKAEDLGLSANHQGYGLVRADWAVAEAISSTPIKPAVNVALSTDKAQYISGDDTAIITAVVTDEKGGAITGLAGEAFTTELYEINFTATETPGTYTGNLSITELGEDTYTLDVTVTRVVDGENISGTGTASFAVVSTSTELMKFNVSVNFDKTTSYTLNSWVYITVKVTDTGDADNAVVGADVLLTVTDPNKNTNSSQGKTNENGEALFRYRVGRVSGTYYVDVVARKDGYEDETYPTTSFQVIK
jgi:subtilisin family serine protease